MNKAITFLVAVALAAASAFAAGTRTATLAVDKMDCAACPITVRKALEKVSGVGSATVDFKTRSAIVVFDPAKATPEALTKATAGAGYPSTVKQLQ